MNYQDDQEIRAGNARFGCLILSGILLLIIIYMVIRGAAGLLDFLEKL